MGERVLVVSNPPNVSSPAVESAVAGVKKIPIDSVPIMPFAKRLSVTVGTEGSGVVPAVKPTGPRLRTQSAEPMIIWNFDLPEDTMYAFESECV
jgi:hypothetical protein